MSRMASGEAVILRPGETRGRLDHALKVGAAETGGAYALRAGAPMSPGRWVAEHIHHREEEAWYVLSGALTFRIGGQTVEAPAGTFVLVPRGIVHSFGNAGTSPATYLELFSPAGMEGYFEERFGLEQATPRAANADYAGLDPAVHGALAQKYGMEFV
jgi:mannose-6-phosphate isomerase-like protein (cupin superfamily)